VNRLIEEEYRKLGPIRYCCSIYPLRCTIHQLHNRYAEWVVAFMFALLVALWFFRDPDFMSGWASYLPGG
jgi:sodium-dependent dicarboxylate transporter 2/3/5